YCPAESSNRNRISIFRVAMIGTTIGLTGAGSRLWRQFVNVAKQVAGNLFPTALHFHQPKGLTLAQRTYSQQFSTRNQNKAVYFSNSLLAFTREFYESFDALCMGHYQRGLCSARSRLTPVIIHVTLQLLALTSMVFHLFLEETFVIEILEVLQQGQCYRL